MELLFFSNDDSTEVASTALLFVSEWMDVQRDPVQLADTHGIYFLFAKFIWAMRTWSPVLRPSGGLAITRSAGLIPPANSKYVP